MEEEDEDSFPLLRPDGIPGYPTEVLVASQEALADLLHSLAGEGPSAVSLLSYALRQQQLVGAELERRGPVEEPPPLASPPKAPAPPSPPKAPTPRQRDSFPAIATAEPAPAVTPRVEAAAPSPPRPVETPVVLPRVPSASSAASSTAAGSRRGSSVSLASDVTTSPRPRKVKKKASQRNMPLPVSAGFVVVSATKKKKNWGTPASKKKKAEKAAAAAEAARLADIENRKRALREKALARKEASAKRKAAQRPKPASEQPPQSLKAKKELEPTPQVADIEEKVSPVDVVDEPPAEAASSLERTTAAPSEPSEAKLEEPPAPEPDAGVAVLVEEEAPATEPELELEAGVEEEEEGPTPQPSLEPDADVAVFVEEAPPPSPDPEPVLPPTEVTEEEPPPLPAVEAAAVPTPIPTPPESPGEADSEGAAEDQDTLDESKLEVASPVLPPSPSTSPMRPTVEDPPESPPSSALEAPPRPPTPPTPLPPSPPPAITALEAYMSGEPRVAAPEPEPAPELSAAPAPSPPASPMPPPSPACPPEPPAAPAAPPQPPVPSYAAAFPEFRHIFTGCIESSIAPSFAAGGASTSSTGLGDHGQGKVGVEAAADVVSEACRQFAMVMADPEFELPADARARKAAEAEGPAMYDPNPPRFYKVMQNKPEVYRIVTQSLTEEAQWHHLPSGVGLKATWNLLWTWSKPQIVRANLLVWQRVNHFKHAKELTRKDLLKKNLARYQCLGPKMNSMFTVLPPTFVLPKEFLAFAEAFGKASGGKAAGNEGSVSIAATAAAALSAGKPPSTDPLDPNWWIMKPVGMSRGRGISLVNDISTISYGDNVVIQKYIPNPLLLDGYKFDLRLYILVTSFSPLEAFLYKEGFARLASHEYNADLSDLHNKFMHLTNSSIQRHSEKAAPIFSEASPDDVGGTKTSLAYLWARLRERGINTDTLWASICDLVVKSLVCADDVVPYQPNSFEVFGYDVLIDSNLKPWLIEVNASPSMGVDSTLDNRIKQRLIADTIALVDPLPFDRDRLAEVIADRKAQTAKAKQRPHVVPAAAGFGSGTGSTTSARERRMLDAQLASVLYGRVPRAYGDMPPNMGEYQRICPGSPSYDKVMRVKLAHLRPKWARKDKDKVKAGVPRAASKFGGRRGSGRHRPEGIAGRGVRK